MTRYGEELQATITSIPGLTVWQLPVHGDNRGWFKENWQRKKMVAAGLPDFLPQQNNVSFNDASGTTRGIHAEPWDKFVSVATGRIFGAWVDLRSGPTFGNTFTTEIDPSRAVFVPRGVGNSYQTLEPNTAYTYLVNDHYSTDAVYAALNLADETAAIKWPIPLNRAELSAKDRNHPRLRDVVPIPRRKTLVIGAAGQLGRALRQIYGGHSYVEFAERADLDLGNANLMESRNWRDYDVVINAAAYTAVDAAETSEGRVAAWLTNVKGVSVLARAAAEHGLLLVQISSDYVFDGTCEQPYEEHSEIAPLSVYGQTKAAADQIVSTVPRHYIIRTSWVIGDGHNFVRTMLSLADQGINPSVVHDQRGRLTFTTDLAQAVDHLVHSHPPYGVYNLSGSGPITSWAEIARQIFSLAGHDPARIKAISSEEYYGASSVPVAPRPSNSALSLEKIIESGFKPKDSLKALAAYVHELLNEKD